MTGCELLTNKIQCKVHHIIAITTDYTRISQSQSVNNMYRSLYVTLHHEMSRNVPDGHFHLFIFSESKFYALYNGENHFQIRGLVAELHVFKHGGMTSGTFGKICFKC